MTGDHVVNGALFWRLVALSTTLHQLFRSEAKGRGLNAVERDPSVSDCIL